MRKSILDRMTRKAEKIGLKFDRVEKTRKTVFNGYKFNKYDFIAVDKFGNEYNFMYSEMEKDKRHWCII